MLTRDKSFYRSYWPFFLALAAQNVISLAVNLLDNVMLGGYTEAALAGAAAVNQIFFLLMQTVFGVTDGLVVLCSQYWGQKRTSPIKQLTSTALYTSAGVAILFFIIVSIFPQGAVSLFTDDQAIITEGVKYLAVIKFTYPLFAISAVLLAMLRSVETVRIAMVISVTTLCINGILNYTLIYGNFGAPRMGSSGAAIATLISRAAELCIVVAYIAFIDKKLHLRLREILRPSKSLTKDYFRVSIPTIIIGVQWGLNTALQTVILGHLSANAIAANSIAVNLISILKVIAVASSAAAGVIIGKTVGSGNLKKVKEYAKTLQIMFLGFGIFIFAATLLLRVPILSLYNVSAETYEMASQFILVLSVTSIGMAYQMPVLTGIVRGGGDTRFVMINDMISVWLIVIPLSFLAAFVFHWPPIAVIACLRSDQVFKCLPAAIKVNSYNWVKKLTRPAKEAVAS